MENKELKKEQAISIVEQLKAVYKGTYQEFVLIDQCINYLKKQLPEDKQEEIKE